MITRTDASNIASRDPCRSTTITVFEALEGSRVVYEQEIDPKPLVSVLDGAIVDALEGLRALIEDGTASRGWTPPTDTGVA